MFTEPIREHVQMPLNIEDLGLPKHQDSTCLNSHTQAFSCKKNLLSLANCFQIQLLGIDEAHVSTIESQKTYFTSFSSNMVKRSWTIFCNSSCTSSSDAPENAAHYFGSRRRKIKYSEEYKLQRFHIWKLRTTFKENWMPWALPIFVREWGPKLSSTDGKLRSTRTPSPPTVGPQVKGAAVRSIKAHLFPKGCRY